MANVALPERGDDSRVAHVNELLGQVADSYGTEVALVEGPPEWCNDESIATNVNYRWDGVHVYTPGAELIYDKVAPQLLQLAATP
jgi:lysophospholipase L1-like esterase